MAHEEFASDELDLGQNSPMRSIFSDIVDGTIPCEKVFESERVLAFKDIAPIAPVHILIIPKKPIPNLQGLEGEDLNLVGEMMGAVQQIAKAFGIEKGYRLLTNNGENAGQTVFHLHFHLIGGRRLGPMG